MKVHPLFNSLIQFKGNARGCVYSEPLNGIPCNLYMPYVSVYMLALGVTDTQIGLTVSISMVFQLILALFSGVITDKLGRRKNTLIFDLISWTIPALISAIAQNFWFFLGAAIINSFIRVTQNSWMCLMVEDSEPDQLIDIFSWIYIIGLLAAFFAPLAGLMIKSISLIPTMRILYLFAAVSFTLKAFITYKMTEETKQGVIKMHETDGKSLFDSLGEYKNVLREILHTPKTLYTAGIMVIMNICMMVNYLFWSIIVTEKIKIPVQNIAMFPFIKSLIMLVFYFVVIPRMRTLHFKIPMIFGFMGFVVSRLVLVLAPVNGYALLFFSVFLEACSLATLNPLVDQLTVLSIDPKERARIQSILYVGIILISTPFGWIAGALSEANKSLPFILNIFLFLVGGILAYLAGRSSAGSQTKSLS
ncbi:MAG: putative major facilitator superfamily transporter [Chloroflexi bacterium]|nr:MAG: putative major facilitator superfamily transporter [Chloroflexota bacterium]